MISINILLKNTFCFNKKWFQNGSINQSYWKQHVSVLICKYLYCWNTSSQIKMPNQNTLLNIIVTFYSSLLSKDTSNAAHVLSVRL